MKKPVSNREGRRRVVASIPEALYVRLYSVKLQTGKSLEVLLEEGATLVIAKHRVEREAGTVSPTQGNSDGG